MRNDKHMLRSAAIALMIGASSIAVAQPAGGALTPASAPDLAAVAAMTQVILKTIEAQPETATSDDIEAAIVYAMDQTQMPAVVSVAALDAIDTTYMPKKVQVAIDNLRKARRRLAGLRGTGGLAAGGAPNLGSGPSVGGGGGSANYQTTSN